MKKYVLASAILFAAAFAASPLVPAFAGHGSEGGQCALKKGGCDHGGGCSSGKGGCPITAKFTKKAELILGHQTELSLSAEQVSAIEALQLDVEKLSARQEADMKIWMLDLDSQMRKEKIDTEAVNAMIDQGSAGMAQGAKAVVEAYAKLKGQLSAQQMQELKKIWKAEKKGGCSHA